MDDADRASVLVEIINEVILEHDRTYEQLGDAATRADFWADAARWIEVISDRISLQDRAIEATCECI